ncbi:hypothetical protein D3C86_1304600 [compost metagenome]
MAEAIAAVLRRCTPAGSNRSPSPSWRPATRGWAPASSAASRSARGVSIFSSSPTLPTVPWPSPNPFARSACSMAAAARRTSSALSGLGRLTRCKPGTTTAARSASKCGVSSPFTRTISVLVLARVSAARSRPDSSARASPFFSSATASSRSKDSASASLASALAKNSGREPGTNSLLLMANTVSPWG